MVDAIQINSDAINMSLSRMASAFEQLHNDLLLISLKLDSFDGDPSVEHWDYLCQVFVIMRDALVMASEDLKDSLATLNWNENKCISKDLEEIICRAKDKSKKC